MQLSRKPVAVALTVTSASNFWPGSSVPTFHTSGFGPLFCAGTALTKVRPLPSVSLHHHVGQGEVLQVVDLDRVLEDVAGLDELLAWPACPRPRSTFILTSVGS